MMHALVLKICPTFNLFQLLFLTSLVSSTGILLSCQTSEPQKEMILQFQNPNIAEGYDSLTVYGVNQIGGDTILICHWKRGETFQQEVKYPPGLNQKFVLLVTGYKNNSLNYQSRAEISDGKATASHVNIQVIAPDLGSSTSTLLARVGTSVTLKPVWKTRPGLLRVEPGTDSTPKFSTLSTYTWRKGNLIVGKDSILQLDSIHFADSGLYVFIAENSAGRDSMFFQVNVNIPQTSQINYPTLKVGEKWVANITSPELQDAVMSMEITKDNTTFNSNDIYEAAVTISAGDFTIGGNMVKNITGTGKTYIRKSDQATLYHIITINEDVIPSGSTTATKIKSIDESTSIITGSAPSILTPGLSWSIKEVETIKNTTYTNDVLVSTTDTVETHTESYTTKNIASVSVSAGTFQAIEIDHDVIETGESVVEYYSQDAKTTIKETTKKAGVVTSFFEVKSIVLVH